jgi:hypothetical protein
MSVLVEDAAQACVSACVQMSVLRRIGDRWGQPAEWAGVGDALVRAMGVVEALEFPRGGE